MKVGNTLGIAEANMHLALSRVTHHLKSILQSRHRKDFDLWKNKIKQNKII